MAQADYSFIIILRFVKSPFSYIPFLSDVSFLPEMYCLAGNNLSMNPRFIQLSLLIL